MVIKLKETKLMQYRMIIEHPNSHKIGDRREVKVDHELLFTEESYVFNHPEYGKMTIILKGEKVFLTYSNSKLEMVYNKKHRILYNTMYGPIEIEVFLKKLDRKASSVHLIYYLYDGDSVLSKCYLMLDEINPIIS